jgi:hypothetical protein
MDAFQRKSIAVQWCVFAAALLAFGAAGYYAWIAKQQWRAMLIANEQTKTALHVTQRAYITTGAPQLDLAKGAVYLPLSNGGHIPSGDIEVVVHEAVFNQPIPDSLPYAKFAVEKSWKRHRLPPSPPGLNFGIVIPTLAASKPKLEAALQAIIIAGVVSYSDGFPDDESQQWPFCMQTTYHHVLKEIIWVPCDGKAITPQLESLDGYPLYEQK